MYKDNKNVFYIIIAIVIATSMYGYLSNLSALKSLLFSLPGVLIAITFHEYAHAFAAYKLGDETAKSQGRLSLNPLNHVDPLGLIMMIFFRIRMGQTSSS